MRIIHRIKDSTMSRIRTTIQKLLDDPDPHLGGDLNVNSQAIVSDAGINIELTPGTGGVVKINGIGFPSTTPEEGQILKVNASGNLEWGWTPLIEGNDYTRYST